RPVAVKPAGRAKWRKNVKRVAVRDDNRLGQRALSARLILAAPLIPFVGTLLLVVGSRLGLVDPQARIPLDLAISVALLTILSILADRSLRREPAAASAAS